MATVWPPGMLLPYSMEAPRQQPLHPKVAVDMAAVQRQLVVATVVEQPRQLLLAVAMAVEQPRHNPAATAVNKKPLAIPPWDFSPFSTRY